MPNRTEVEEALAEIEADMRRMLVPDSARFDLAWNIWSKSMSLASESPDLMHPLWLIWGALTDWVELRPEESTQAEATMVRASTEWLAIPKADSHGRTAYLDRWVYDEMGYERHPVDPGGAADGGGT
jgi:hypothetical protein